MKQINIVIITISVIFAMSVQASVKDRLLDVPEYTGKIIWYVISNQYIQKYGSGLLFIYSQGVCDAKADGWLFDNLYGDKITYGINETNWHYYKSIGRVATFGAFGLKGLALGQKHITLKDELQDTGAESFIAWTIWHKFYYKTRDNNYWDTDHAQHIIYYPNPFNKFNDAFIGLKGNQVFAFDILRLSIGIGGLLK